ncbi:hypothetical protein PA25_05060 [Pseudoalteromonas sp. A25]|uniref:hypothetical protein n=1 Tax=Pseudoalteromonas sp. A25 TaxID=116092 RepID=UPI001260C091|nr:hypothetical protein [Pseudoalteromonas sp. A25]BBN80521.1 hypothetical protein PA25_05060 [Pseudoalteromonas sp. A25]
MNNTKVIAISGMSGSGKTTQVKLLAHLFDCPYLLFDDYSNECTYPSDMAQWLREGANVSLIRSPGFVNALHHLVTSSSRPFVFIEEPFGKERAATRTLIDTVILLDTPAEVCLSRVIKRHIAHNHANAATSINKYLAQYDSHYREIYISVVNQVRQNADLVVKDVTSIADTTQFISGWLSKSQ